MPSRFIASTETLLPTITLPKNIDFHFILKYYLCKNNLDNILNIKCVCGVAKEAVIALHIAVVLIAETCFETVHTSGHHISSTATCFARETCSMKFID